MQVATQAALSLAAVFLGNRKRRRFSFTRKKNEISLQTNHAPGRWGN